MLLTLTFEMGKREVGLMKFFKNKTFKVFNSGVGVIESTCKCMLIIFLQCHVMYHAYMYYLKTHLLFKRIYIFNHKHSILHGNKISTTFNFHEYTVHVQYTQSLIDIKALMAMDVI